MAGIAMNALFVLLFALLLYVAAGTLYYVIIAAAYFIIREPQEPGAGKKHRFAVIIPAHNEELFIGRLCDSLLSVDYPRESFEVFVVADNCTDRTARASTARGATVLVRDDEERRGKGYAVEWGMRNIPLDAFDALLVVDADSTVDAAILNELNRHLNRGEQAIQCCNAVGNRQESAFTRILSVSRTVNNLLYHHSKYKLGLSSYLMGNGICFSVPLLQGKGWTAFSIGEDWEYSARLWEDGVSIAFARNACVFHQESRSLDQATSQRLRWSGGRFAVVRAWGMPLFMKGFLGKDWIMLDASLPLIFPNYSLLANLTLFAAILCLALQLPLRAVLAGAALFCLVAQAGLFITGAFLAGSPLRTFTALFYAPVFLAWKSVIDIVSFTGIHQASTWIRTERRVPK